MLLLIGTAAKVQVVTGSTAAVDVHTSLVDMDGSGNVSESTQNTAITTASTTDVTGSPASGSTRNVKVLNVRNKSAGSVTVTVRHTDGTTTVDLYSATLTTGQTLLYMDGIGWATVPAASTGQASSYEYGRVTADVASTSTSQQNITGLSFAIAGSQVVSFEALLYLTVGTSTTFPFSVIGPASPVSVLTGWNVQSGATASTGVVTAHGTTFSPSLGSAVVNTMRIWGTVVNGVNAGTIQLQFASNTTNAVTAKAGSFIVAYPGS